MNDSGGCLFIGFLVGCLITYTAGHIIFKPDLDNYYKQGQIDYANDIIKYELQEQDNHEYIWVRKDVD